MKKFKIFAILLALLTFVSFGFAGCSCTSKGKSAPKIVGESSFEFDKSAQVDIVVEVDLKGYELVNLLNGSDTVGESAYSLSANKLTVNKGYLNILTNGNYTFSISTAKGEAKFTIAVKGEVISDEFVRPDYNAAYYDNLDFNEYVKGEQTTIKGQWEGYGIGDPFIMRFNGMYYLYASTLDSEKGIRAWKSRDLVEWTQCQGQGQELGYVSSDPITRASYAPEVFYFNDTFYLYTSPGGGGHYIMTANSPEGPFVPVSDNIGLSIDGSVLIDDDEQMYFTRASNTGIRIHNMTDMKTIATNSVNLDNTQIGDWTEGSYILKKDDQYFLTYTGNHVASDAYRVSYAVSQSDNIYSRSAFDKGAELPIILDTKENFKGLGHSASFLGPDMDSYYITYHSLNNAGGPNRSLNIDRLLFNGSQMSVAANSTGSVKANLPKFYADDTSDAAKFTKNDNAILSTQKTSGAFTAEYNFSGSDEIKFLAGYTSSDNYVYVSVDFTAKSVSLYNVTAGNKALISGGTLKNDFNKDSIHSVRVSYRDGKADVYFDNMKKIKEAEITIGEGAIGYFTEDENASLYYTAFSQVAKGLSDEAEFKQSNAHIGADTYLSQSKFGIQTSTLSADSGLTTLEDANEFTGAKQMNLTKLNEQATYLVNFRQDGFYGIEMIYDKAYCDKSIGIKVDGSDVMMVTLPVVETQERIIKTLVTEVDVKAGVNQIRLENVGDEIGFISFKFVKTSKHIPQFENSLEEYVARGVDYKTIWKTEGGGHFAKAGTRQLVYFGDETLTDYTIEVEIKLVGNTATSTAGLILRGANYASSSHDNYKSIQGYYISLNNSQIKAEKLNYAYSENLNNGVKVVNNASDSFIKIKVEARGNNFKVYKEGELMLDCTDAKAISSGRIGLYTNGAAVVYRNLKISE